MRAFLIAGEASGDALGASLMAGLRARRPDATFQGVGGALMQAEGMQSLFPMDELSVMGLAEILPRYFDLRRRLLQTVEAVIAARPDVLIGIDSPDFTLRVAARVRARANIRTVHYVAPSVWAWRPKRAARMAPHVDQVLALLPFEPPLMEAAGMRCDFVGHPVAAEPPVSPVVAAETRAALAPDDAPLLLVLPGSRRSEVARLAPVFGAALERLRQRRPGLRVVLPAAPGVADLVREMAGGWPDTTILDAGDAMRKRAAFAAADAALAASGTVSLELAAAGTPMVIAYDAHPVTRAIVSRMLLTDTVTLVNLVSETRTIPEYIGRACRPDPIAAAVDRLLADPGAQMAALDLTMARLGRDGPAPGVRAADAVLDGIG